MCLIAFRPAGEARIPTAVIDAALNRHPDGFGIAYRVDGALHVKRFTPSERTAFADVVRAVDASGHEYVAHFRFATSGPKDRAHAHPYEYEDPDPSVGKVLVFHNGVIPVKTTAQQSDTEVFVKGVLAALPSRWWENAAIRFLVTETIGWSKLTLMTAEETVNLHDARGEWDGGLWYSSAHRPSYNAWSSARPVKAGPAAGCANPALAGPSRRQQKREARAARKAARTAMLAENAAGAKAAALTSASEPSVALGKVAPQTLVHGGHVVDVLVDIDRSKDSDFLTGGECRDCASLLDLYVVDGRLYADGGHRQVDLLAAAGM